MMFFRKKESKHDDDSLPTSKVGQFFYMLKKAACSVVYKIGKKFGMEQPTHYDLDLDGNLPSSSLIKKRVCDIIFLIYGFFAGIIGEQYAEYECRAFQAFACNKSLTSPNLESSPMTIIASIIIIFSVYLSVAVVWGCIYFLLKSTLLKNDGDDEIELLQISAMYSLLEIIFLGLLFFAIPFNAFIFVRT